MYALVCLYLLCIAICAASAVQSFWNEDEFCKKLNFKHAEQSSIGVFTKHANITCVHFNDSKPKTDDVFVLNNVRLLCREFDSLTYAWNDNTENATDLDITIVVEFMSYNTTDMHLIVEVNQTNSSYIRFDNLQPNTEYVARFRTLIDGTADHTTDAPVEMTLDNVRKPDPVHTIRLVSNFELMNNESSLLKISLAWTPSKDMSCHYKILSILQTEHLDYSEFPKEYIVDYAETRSYSVTFLDLKTDSVYTAVVQSYYENTLPVKASNKTKLNFSTPTCLAVKHYDWNLCAPEDPYDVIVTETAAWGDGRYDAKVDWKSPNPDGRGVEYFRVKLHDEAVNVTSAVNDAYFRNVRLDDHYLASVQAFSPAGQSKETVVWQHRRLEYAVSNGHSENHNYYFYVWTTVLTVSVFCTVLAVGRHVYRWLTAVNGGGAGAAYAAGRYDMAVLKSLDDVDMLLKHEDVTVSDVFLGHGHFGVVRKGVLLRGDGGCPVAVKSLRDRPSSRDLEEFRGEILLMQKVGKHPNIVSMIGCCLDANNRCMLVVEYCPLGDLQTYLRKVSIKSWYANDFYVNRTNEPSESTTVTSEVDRSKEVDGNPPPPPPATDASLSMVFNNCYLYHGEENVFLTVDDLMRFASQAANGMMFLEKNRIVHRDLAARNVLLSDHHTIKICDFGLSRDIYEQNLYQKSNRGDPLPIKWMALESLKYRVYTSQSDVWSFGVLLWEIMMLGSCPYPTISSSRIYEMLSEGYRMPRPPLCCHSLYEVMLMCWHSNPTNRPKFGLIKDMIDSIMGN